MMMPLLVIVECGLRLFKILNICMYVCVCMYASSFRKRELIQREKEKRRCTTSASQWETSVNFGFFNVNRSVKLQQLLLLLLSESFSHIQENKKKQFFILLQMKQNIEVGNRWWLKRLSTIEEKKKNRYCPPCNEELTSGIDVTVDLAWPIMLQDSVTAWQRQPITGSTKLRYQKIQISGSCLN